MQLSIHSKELSSLKEMDKLFEDYCKERGIALDFTKGSCCNAYLSDETSNAFIWWIRGIFLVVN